MKAITAARKLKKELKAGLFDNDHNYVLKIENTEPFVEVNTISVFVGDELMVMCRIAEKYKCLFYLTTTGLKGTEQIKARFISITDQP